ncbi:aminotransferase class I/II-fold pyridoxal phosphate-dependent enzyme [uncultured Shewanella sp.]|uniref:aminotransferase class I/II-fold pyridoxal phosphate-dependent enzyme n=1 Tax=uncultured Shewanella sp. TaxID=173975 RepID=UPI00261FE500|nr:aminotransferase class I/II-fold pyridoxal phosphate-dependent enzyme [uncultured Shewanella sp.]
MALFPKVIDDIHYKPMQFAHINEVADILTSAFISFEPGAIAMHIEKTEMIDFVHHLCLRIYEQNLSIVAIDVRDNDRVVGAFIAHDLQDDLSSIHVCEALLPMMTLIDEAISEIKPLDDKKTLDQVMIGVDLAYAGKGIAAQLIDLSRRQAIVMGFERFIGVMTSPVTYHIAQQVSAGGHHHFIEKRYADFRYEGRTIFNNINEKMPAALKWRSDPVYGILVQDFSLPMREKPTESIEQEYLDLLAGIKSRKRQMLGKPGNMAFDFSSLSDGLEVLMNNSGDPFCASSHRLSTKGFERKVIHFFAKQYGLSEDNTYGYVTSGGTEAMEYGLLKGFKQFPNAVVLLSKESHYSAVSIVEKYNKKYELLPCLSNGEIDYTAFQNTLMTIEEPVVVLANIGSTMKGAIDDVAQIKALLGDKPHFIHGDAALHGSFLPFLPEVYGAKKLIIGEDVDALSISLHKFLGNITPAGLVLTKKQDNNGAIKQDYIEYIASDNNTLTCSRSGLAALLAAYRIDTLQENGIKEQGMRCVDLALYLQTQLKFKGIEAELNNASNIVYMPAPNEVICQKWMLPVTQGMSHVVVMPHADKSLLDEFVAELS